MSETSSRLKQKIETVPISVIQKRQGNPNEMTKDEKHQLEYSLQTIDYVQPIIIDQDNVVVDGAHRLDSLKGLGYETVDVVRIHVKDEKHRALISQAMNKIRGEHNTEKDIEELRGLMGYDADTLYELLHIDETSLTELQQKHEEELLALQKFAEKAGRVNIVEEDDGEGNANVFSGEIQEKDGRVKDSSPVSRWAETYLHGGIKQINLFFNNEEYQVVFAKLEKIMEREKLESNTDLFKLLLQKYEEAFPLD